jgi:hypothetical protein
MPRPRKAMVPFLQMHRLQKEKAMNRKQTPRPLLRSRHPTSQTRQIVQQLRWKKQRQQTQHPKLSQRPSILLQIQRRRRLLKNFPLRNLPARRPRKTRRKKIRRTSALQ